MAIEYKKIKLKEIKFKENDFLVFPTDYKIKLFPSNLKVIAPNSFEIFKELSNYIKMNNSDIPDAFFFPPFSDPNLVSIMCVGDDKLIAYESLFNSLKFIHSINDECTIYIMEEWFDEYLRNFEVFEFDIEKEFGKENCTITIVNESKGYNYNYEEEPSNEPTT